MTKILKCRIDDCGTKDRFPHVQAVNASGWSEISPFSIVSPEGDTMKGYCPTHSEATDPE